MKENITVPEHYFFVLDGLEKIKTKIEKSFINRPIPQGSYVDYYEIYNMVKLDEDVMLVLNSLKVFSEEILSCKESVLRYKVNFYLQKIDDAFSNLIDRYHLLWRRPFPKELAQVQILVSAILEKILKEILKCVNEVIEIIKNPEEYVEKYGSESINIEFNFDIQREIEELNNITPFENRSICSGVRNKALGHQHKGCTFFDLALSFLLGWWIGRD
jgi:hypothetical protein